jgi:hypothetical protein
MEFLWGCDIEATARRRGQGNAKVPERKIQRKRFCKSNSTAALHVFVTTDVGESAASRS